MGRRSDVLVARLDSSACLEADQAIQVVSRAFDILRCFEGGSVCLRNREIADRCNLPPSTVSRLTSTLVLIGQLSYLPEKQKYTLGSRALALDNSSSVKSCDKAVCIAEELPRSAGVHETEDQFVV